MTVHGKISVFWRLCWRIILKHAVMVGAQWRGTKKTWLLILAPRLFTNLSVFKHRRRVGLGVGSQGPKSCLKTYTTPASKDVSCTFLFPFIKQNQRCEKICLTEALCGLISKCLSFTRKVEHSGLNAERHYKLGFYLIPWKNIITHYYWVPYAI